MQVEILLPADESKKGVINLKNYIDKASIEGVESTQINRTEHHADEMGAGDLLNSIATIIEAAEKPLVELVVCLQKYVETYRTSITIPTKSGGNIVLSHGRSMKPEQLQQLVTAIQQS